MNWLEVALSNLEEAKRKGNLSEADTKRLIIEPLLAWVGYDPWSYGSVWEEYSLPVGTERERPDYALMDDGEVYMLLEAKSLGTPLDAFVEKVATYCYHQRIRFGVLTNGEVWVLIDAEWKGHDRGMLRIKITDKVDLRGEVPGYYFLKLLHPSMRERLYRLVAEIRDIKEKGLKEEDVRLLINAKMEKALRDFAPETYHIEPVDESRFITEATVSKPQPSLGTISVEWYPLFKAYTRGELRKHEFQSKLRGRVSPRENVCIGEKRIFITSWRQLLREVVEWLIARGHITGPVMVSGRRTKLYLVNTERSNPGSSTPPERGFDKDPLSNGMYLWSYFSGAHILMIIADLLKQFGYDPLEVVKPC